MENIIRNKGLPKSLWHLVKTLAISQSRKLTYFVLMLVLVLVFFVSGSHLIFASLFQTSGTFPNEPFNGLQINYNVSGARITKAPEDTFNFTTVRKIQGALGDGQLSISGSVKGAGFFTDASIEVWAGDQRQKTSMRVESNKSANFNLSVRIPTTAASGGFSIICVGNYNVGTRGLEVLGYLSMMAPVGKDTTTHETKPLSDNAILKTLLDKYMRAIPKGMAPGGFTNNVCSFFDKRFKDFACGGYQAKVLAFLDAIKWSKDPNERALLDKFDYGPIQAYYGGHQAVVIYPKGTNWLETGTVLDPWPTQSPTSCTTQEWAVRFGLGSYHGVSGSSVYETHPEYPTVGGDYVNPANNKLSTEEKNWYQNQPQDYRNRINRYQSSDPNFWRHLISYGYNNRNRTGQVAVHCPVDVRLKDSAGRVTGFAGNEFRREIPDVVAARMPDGKGGWITWFEYPENISCNLVIKANDSGKVEAFFGHGAGPVNTGSTFRYNFAVTKGEKISGDAITSGANLSSDHGVISPTTVRSLADLNISNVPNDSDVSTSNPSDLHPARQIFDNGNIYGVQNSPNSPTWFKLENSTLITEITTYHWNNARGMRPGTISLIENSSKRVFGPWQTVGLEGMYRVPNATWVAKPNVVLPPGVYIVIDSSPETWSHNQQSNYSGFAKVTGQTVKIR